MQICARKCNAHLGLPTDDVQRICNDRNNFVKSPLSTECVKSLSIIADYAKDGGPGAV